MGKVSTPDHENKESLLARWSRRKQEARARPRQDAPTPAAQRPADAAPLPDLPPPDRLGFDSDFSGFMDARVDETLRRLALKKLFGDPRFNIRDGLDDYAENYAALEDLSPAVIDQLQHVRRTLQKPEPDAGETPATQAAEEHVEQAAAQAQPPADVDAAPAAQENKE